MIEYIGDIVKMSSGQDNIVTAYIFDEDGSPITEGVTFEIKFPDNHPTLKVDGIYNEEELMWSFPVSGEDTDGFFGKFEYCICHNGCSLCFPSIIYLVGEGIWLSK